MKENKNGEKKAKEQTTQAKKQDLEPAKPIRAFGQLITIFFNFPQFLFSFQNAFEAGVTNAFYDDLMSNCQVGGALNETIGSFTCTRPCGPPTNYSEVFVLNWDEEGSGQVNGDIIFSTDDDDGGSGEGSGEGSGGGGGDIFHEDVIVEIGYVVK